MEQYFTALKRAAILSDFERQLHAALQQNDEIAVATLAERYLDHYPWLAEEFYRKVCLRERRRALEARIRTLDRLLAGHNPKTVRYLSEGWRHQRDEATTEMRELEANAALDPPAWPQILVRFRALVRES